MTLKPTKLIYMTEMFQLEAHAKILDLVSWPDERLAVILDQTIFYPQGGGQPYDTGFIQSSNALFKVEEVRFKDGIVYHVGTLQKGNLHKDDDVTIQINQERRRINSRNHTAGHIIDIAMSNLGMKLKPGRGYHFPQGAYVEYIGALDETERESLLPKLQQEVNVLLAQNLPVSIKMVSIEELNEMAQFVPDYTPKDKPSRAMIIQGYYAIPCGGTHVAHIGDIGTLTIQKIKNKKGNLRISYSVN